MKVKKRTASGSLSEPAVVDIPSERQAEMATQTPMVGSRSQGEPTNDPTELVEKLSAAIQAGEASQAASMVAEISKMRLKLNINIPKDDMEQRNKEREFSVRVHIEDRISDGCFINLTVKSCDTIGDLKRKVMLKHNFPMEVQRWIIGKKIPRDEERLSKCGIRGPGHTLYLYLVTARSVGLSQQDYEVHHQAVLEGRVPSNPYYQGPLSSTDQSTDQISWPPPPSPSEVKSRTYSNSPSPARESSPVSGMGEMDEASSHYSGTSRQVSKRSLSSGSNLINEMLTNIHTPLIAAGGDARGSVSSESGVSETTSSTTGNKSHASSSGPAEDRKEGWICPACTFLNLPTRPGCEMCSGSRPSSYQVPDNYQMTEREIELLENDQRLEKMTREAEEKQVKENFKQIMAIAGQDLIANTEIFQCAICFEEIDVGEGIVLRDCLHQFCRECLTNAVIHCEDATVRCPYQDDIYSCESMLQEREIKALVPQEVYRKFLQRGLDQAESQTANSYHCKTADCRGWCEYEDLVNFFKCPVCKKENCLTCKAIHEGQNCKQYQENLRVRAENDTAAKQTADMLRLLVASGDAMHCPQCQVIVQKKSGCDWIKCSICKTEICWVTKGPRWGPNGEGDFSGGCKCRLGGKKCHPQCGNCH